MNLTLVLTHACNLRCHYCYAGSPKLVAMPRETVDAALAFGVENRVGDTFQLGFFGGEPLLEWDLLKYAFGKACDLLGQDGFLRTVTTNATLLTEERAEWLRAADIYVGISQDGNRAMHEATRPFAGGRSSFDAVLAGLHHARDGGCRFEVVSVVDPSNVAHVSDAVRFLCDEQGVDRISLNPNFYTEWDAGAVATFDEQYARVADFVLERYRANRPVAVKVFDGKIITRLKDGYACGDRCGFGAHELAVAPSGNLYPCERVVGTDEGGELCLGHVIEGVDECKRLKVLAARGNRDQECADCELGSRCMNWCGCVNYGTTGRIDSTGGFVCHHERTVVREADRIGSILFGEGNPAFLKRFYER